MFGVAIDAVVLMLLLQAFNDEDIGFGLAFVVALVAAIGTAALTFGLVMAMGLAGAFVAAVVAAGLLGVAVSALFGVEIKRSFLIGAIFMVIHIMVGIFLRMLFSS